MCVHGNRLFSLWASDVPFYLHKHYTICWNSVLLPAFHPFFSPCIPLFALVRDDHVSLLLLIASHAVLGDAGWFIHTAKTACLLENLNESDKNWADMQRNISRLMIFPVGFAIILAIWWERFCNPIIKGKKVCGRLWQVARQAPITYHLLEKMLLDCLWQGL